MFIVTLKREITRNNRNFFVFLSRLWCFLTFKKIQSNRRWLKKPNRVNTMYRKSRTNGVRTIDIVRVLRAVSRRSSYKIQSATTGRKDSAVIRYVVFDWNFLAISVNINIVEGNEANQFTITKQDVGRANFQWWKFNFRGNLYSFLKRRNDRSRQSKYVWSSHERRCYRDKGKTWFDKHFLVSLFRVHLSWHRDTRVTREK